MFRNILFNVFHNSCCTRKLILSPLLPKIQLSYFSPLTNCNPFLQLHYPFHQSIVNKNVPLPYYGYCKTNFQPYSTKETPKTTESQHHGPEAPITAEPAQKLSIFQRFKATYAAYGKLCLVIHFTTYCGWFSAFYLIVRSGLDIKWYLTILQFPEWITNMLNKPGVGELATAYILCKIFMVFRYALTIYLTRSIGHRLQKMGYMAPIKEENKIRNLAKEGKELSKVKLKSHLEKKIKR